MRVMICGGSNYRFRQADYKRLDDLREELGITAVLSSGAPGAELGGEVWAATRQIAIRRFGMETEHSSKTAAMYRRPTLAPTADAVVAFPGGRDVQAMLDAAKACSLRVYDWRKEAEEQATVNDLAARLLDR